MFRAYKYHPSKTGSRHVLHGSGATPVKPRNTITYARNANGQVNGVSAVVAGSPVNLASSIAYLPFGPLNAMTYGNALTFSAAYDQDYNPTNRTVSGIYNHAYDTDDNGNIIQIGATDYGYDALNRLDEEDSGSSVTYTYDATSNRLTKNSGGTTTTTVPGDSNKISAVGGDSYSYDSAGNVTAIDTHGYTWNAAGQLAGVEISSATVGAYTYDSQNRRTKKVAGGNTTHYVYGLNGLLYGEYDDSGDLIREYIYLDNTPLAQIDAGTPEVLTYLHPDHLGTPRFGTDTGGTQVWAANADAFGVGTPSGAATVNLRMPGQYADAESDLFYNWNRYYNPATGRYISSDPIGIEGGLNTFLYAEASPVMYDDPEGLQAAAACIAGPNPICLAGIGQIAIGAGIGAGVGIGSVLWNAINVPDTAPDVAGGMCVAASEPPGNCTPEEHRQLQDGVENACGAAIACRGGDDIATLNRKIGMHSACIDARKRINDRCFGGGDSGHQTSVEERKGSIRNCQNLISGFGR